MCLLVLYIGRGFTADIEEVIRRVPSYLPNNTANFRAYMTIICIFYRPSQELT
jgi:hypothetical protein